MRVYYVTSGLQGCYFVRSFLPLTENGWDGDITTMLLDQQMKTPDNKAYASQRADVVVFHRPDDPKKLELARLLRQQGKKIVFDNDDTYKDDGGFKFNKYLDKERLEKNLGTINETIDKFIREADLVTTSTQFLADEYKKLNPNVIVLPNCVDPFYFDEHKVNQSDDVRFAINGSVGVTSDFEHAYNIINRTYNEPNVHWLFWSLPINREDKIVHELYYEEYKKLDEMIEGKKITWYPFVNMEIYFDQMNEMEIDVMVIPRADNYFNRCKSNLKFLETAMFEIPCIAQGFPDGQSPYQQDPEDAEYMIIANSEDEFVDHVKQLSKDRAKIRELGKKARKYVEEKYSIENNAHKWVEAYQSLFEKHE